MIKKLKNMYIKKLEKVYDIEKISTIDSKKLNKALNSYKKKRKKEIKKEASKPSMIGLVYMIFCIFFPIVAVFLLIYYILRIGYYYYKIYIVFDNKYKTGKSFLKREKEIGKKPFYIIWILVGSFEHLFLFKMNFLLFGIIIVIMIGILSFLHKDFILIYWKNFDSKRYKEIDKNNPHQPKTKLENEIINKYYYEIEKYLKEEGILQS